MKQTYRVLNPRRFATLAFFALLLSAVISEAQINGPSITEAPIPSGGGAATLVTTINCDMVECPNFSNDRLKAIVWSDQSGGAVNSYLYVELGSTQLTSPPIQIAGAGTPDVVIGDDLNAAGNQYIIAIVYQSGNDVFIETYLADLVNSQVTYVNGSTNQLNTTASAKLPHIDLFPDQSNTVGSFPSLHKYVAVWDGFSGTSTIQYTTGDISTVTPATPTFVLTSLPAGDKPDVAALIDGTDEIACITFIANNAYVHEINLTTPGVNPVQLTTASTFNRIEALGIYNGSNAKWQVVGDGGGVIIAENDLSNYNCSNGLDALLMTTETHLTPAVAAGIGAPGGNNRIGNVQYTIGWRTTNTPNLYSQNIDVTNGALFSSGVYEQINDNSTIATPLALSNSSNSGFGILSAWFDGSDIVYKETSNTGAPPIFGYKTTSIGRLSGKKSDVYPNPVSDKLTVDVENGITYCILDLMGRNIQQGSINNQSLDVSSLSAGIYLLQIQGVSGYKFIKE